MSGRNWLCRNWSAAALFPSVSAERDLGRLGKCNRVGCLARNGTPTPITRQSAGISVSASGHYPTYDNHLETLEISGLAEHNARNIVERLAISVQAAVLINAKNSVSEASCKLRFDRTGYLFGASGAVIDTRSIIERAMPT